MNDFLQQLESHRGIVACTTNLYRDLDQASLRRFTFKIGFEFLDPARCVLLFRGLLAPWLREPVDEAVLLRALGRWHNLTPGDFAAVVRRLQATGVGAGQASVDVLLAELGAEANAKEDRARSVGY